MKLERRDFQGIASALEPVLERVVRDSLAGVIGQREPLPSGIQVLSPADVAARIGRSVRHLVRMEAAGKLPRRRRFGLRRTCFYAHELDGVPAEQVAVIDSRRLNREDLAEKLGVNERTLDGLEDLPEPVDGQWFERDIDRWLLSRPLA